MTYAIVHHFKGATQAQFEAVSAKVDPAGGGLVPGEILEISGPSEEGWMIVGLFESKGAWERFRDETLAPSLREVGDTGFAGPPDELSFDVVNTHHKLA
ncbi:MAG TPA: hypothetical protein VNE42_11670 [Acidimicrobiales bacterium]|nr:hypothetical protein [Acidimicrobiales bacterium]